MQQLCTYVATEAVQLLREISKGGDHDILDFFKVAGKGVKHFISNT